MKVKIEAVPEHLAQRIRDEFANGVRRNGPPVLGYHAVRKLDERNISSEQLAAALRDGDVLEIEMKNGDARLLVRDAVGVCVSYSLNTQRVITVYYSDPLDTHATLDTSVYFTGEVTPEMLGYRNGQEDDDDAENSTISDWPMAG